MSARVNENIFSSRLAIRKSTSHLFFFEARRARFCSRLIHLPHTILSLNWGNNFPQRFLTFFLLPHTPLPSAFVAMHTFARFASPAGAGVALAGAGIALAGAGPPPGVIPVPLLVRRGLRRGGEGQTGPMLPASGTAGAPGAFRFPTVGAGGTVAGGGSERRPSLDGLQMERARESQKTTTKHK